MEKIDEINAVVEDEVTDTEVAEGSGRDYLKDGLAVGLGLLALDGAVHVGKFVYTKGLKPVGQKISGKFKEAKTKRQLKKAQKAVVETIDEVKDTVQEIVE